VESVVGQVCVVCCVAAYDAHLANYTSQARACAFHVARMEEGKSCIKVSVGKSEEKNHLEDPGLDGR